MYQVHHLLTRISTLQILGWVTEEKGSSQTTLTVSQLTRIRHENSHLTECADDSDNTCTSQSARKIHSTPSFPELALHQVRGVIIQGLSTALSARKPQTEIRSALRTRDSQHSTMREVSLDEERWTRTAERARTQTCSWQSLPSGDGAKNQDRSTTPKRMTINDATRSTLPDGKKKGQLLNQFCDHNEACDCSSRFVHSRVSVMVNSAQTPETGRAKTVTRDTPLRSSSTVHTIRRRPEPKQRETKEAPPKQL